MKPFAIVVAFGLAMLAACTSHTVKVEPIEVKPIHLTMDINVRVQRELDDFFDDIEEEAEEAATTEPSSEEEG